MERRYGWNMRQEMVRRDQIPFIGVYDAFSASIAGRHYDGIFLSGFGFAASFYGLPDIGFIAWSDMAAYVQRIRTVLPTHHLLVDIDDGYCDTEVACHVVSLLESVGASGVILEDQQRPRRCGHYEGKQIMELDAFLRKLERVLSTRRDLVVVARTDAAAPDEIVRRVKAFADAGADAILVDAIRDLETIRELKSQVGKPFVFNQIAGGKSPACTLPELRDVGANLVIYSTPCLFTVQSTIDLAMKALKESDGRLPDMSEGCVGVKECTALLNENLAGRDRR